MFKRREEDEDVGASETYSQSSHEDDDDDEIEDDNVPFWRQHWPALVAAVVAAVVSHSYNTRSSVALFPFLEPSTVKHAHLESFVRTANVSFCPSPQGRQHPRLNVLDFYIPQEYYSTLHDFYLADSLDVDSYADLLTSKS